VVGIDSVQDMENAVNVVAHLRICGDILSGEGSVYVVRVGQDSQEIVKDWSSSGSSIEELVVPASRLH
jgi:hypothetical protein